MKTLILAVVLLTSGFSPWGAERAGAQGVDSCLADYDTIFASQYVSPHMPYTTLINTDSAFLDTCSGSATYREFYVKQWFDFAFQYGSMLQLPAAPADTILEVSWTAIDTNYPTTRNAFHAMELKYGTFYLRKRNPDVSDTSEPFSTSYKIRFVNYICEDSAWNDFKTIPEIYDTFLDDGLVTPQAGGGVKEVKEEGQVTVFPNPSGNFIFTSGPIAAPLRLYNELGTCVKVLNPVDRRIALDGLPAGIYFLRCQSNCIRFIKEP